MIARRARRAAEVALYAPLGALATVVARLRAGRPTLADVVDDASASAQQPRDQPAPRLLTEPVEAPGAAAPTLPQAGEPPPDEAALPIDDYDHLAASQILDRLAALTPPELELVADYERAHRHRQTVLGRVAQLLP